MNLGVFRCADVVAVDPGLSGAVVRLNAQRHLGVWRNFATLRDLSVAARLALMSVMGRTGVRLVIEQVHAMPGQGVCSTFSFGRATGTALGAFMSLWPEQQVFEVTPQRWQNWYRNFLDIPKAAGSFDSTVIAPQVLTPDMLDQCRKKRGSLDHNACDAALIAVWCANQTEEELAERVSEHWKTPEKKVRTRRKQTAD